MGAAMGALFVHRLEGSTMGKLFDNESALQVGQVHLISNESEPEEWQAWLWPVAGRYPTEHGGHCESIKRKGTLGVLAEALLKRGQWWANPA